MPPNLRNVPVPARRAVQVLALALSAAFAPGALAAGGAGADSAATAPRSDSLAARRTGALRLFVDCPECDQDFIRKEITFVDHVRDRLTADIHALVTDLDTGANGSEVTVTFMGRGPCEGISDTLRFVTGASDTDDMIRRRLVQVLKLGLVRFAARTPLAERIAVSYSEPAAAPRPVVDRWNKWVFTTSLNGWFNGQSSTRTINTWGSLSARRVAENTKVSLSLNESYYENRFDLGGGQHLVSISRSRSANSQFVQGFGEHWSAAAWASAYSSTYSNTELDWGVGPALEFNLFPYSQSTRRQLRFDYYMTYHRAIYERETIFLKMRESLWREGLEVVVDAKEPWGSTEISVEGAHYMHDLKKNRLTTSGSVSLRIVEGLSVKVSGNASRVRDQLSLPAQGATLEEILLQRRQLATQYQYYVSVGLSYTFGSIYNNIVNARFGS
ncbi:MAG: hypothetical protein HZC42_04075 [Candidatus Eisenbacteria bacterium]|nr:hypothetical protein [Candidatus Eisenbacteria bacterium]